MNNLNKLNKMEFATLLSVFISRLSISNMPELRKLFETNGIDNPEIVYNIVFALLSLNIFMIEREKE